MVEKLERERHPTRSERNRCRLDEQEEGEDAADPEHARPDVDDPQDDHVHARHLLAADATGICGRGVARTFCMGAKPSQKCDRAEGRQLQLMKPIPKEPALHRRLLHPMQPSACEPAFIRN
jgi:hypothetical protein